MRVSKISAQNESGSTKTEPIFDPVWCATSREIGDFIGAYPRWCVVSVRVGLGSCNGCRKVALGASTVEKQVQENRTQRREQNA